MLTRFVPLWTRATAGDLHGPVDYVIANSMTLVPSALIGDLWIHFASFKAPQTA
jgi:hypothetical protein